MRNYHAPKAGEPLPWQMPNYRKRLKTCVGGKSLDSFQASGPGMKCRLVRWVGVVRGIDADVGCVFLFRQLADHPIKQPYRWLFDPNQKRPRCQWHKYAHAVLPRATPTSAATGPTWATATRSSYSLQPNSDTQKSTASWRLMSIGESLRNAGLTIFEGEAWFTVFLHGIIRTRIL